MFQSHSKLICGFYCRLCWLERDRLHILVVMTLSGLYILGRSLSKSPICIKKQLNLHSHYTLDSWLGMRDASLCIEMHSISVYRIGYWPVLVCFYSYLFTCMLISSIFTFKLLLWSLAYTFTCYCLPRRQYMCCLYVWLKWLILCMYYCKESALGEPLISHRQFWL